MKITIDNYDGAGALDYSSCLSSLAVLKIERSLNKPTQCTFTVDTNNGSLGAPVQYARVVVITDAAIVLFTGYIARSPTPVFVGAAFDGDKYALQVIAISDEMLLDQQSVPVTAGSAGVTLQSAMKALTQRVDAARVSLDTISTSNSTGYFAADAAEDWSHNAGRLAASTRTAYRVLNGQLSVVVIGATTHVLSDADGSLDVSKLSMKQIKTLANDVTVCGESEAQAYVTDLFQGDGTTVHFNLSRTPLHLAATRASLIVDSFGGPTINPLVWTSIDPGARFTITPAGLSVNGGNGLDGQTTVSAIDNTEMAGALVLTAGGVQSNGVSDGYIACFYGGSILLKNLFAGFHVKQSSGSTVVVPVINGIEAGSFSTMAAGRAYTFRLRYESKEMQRVKATYYVTGSNGQQAFGGDVIESTARLVFEVQDTTGGLNQPTVVLYDGSVSSAPATCTLAAVNSPALNGSVQSVSLKRSGTAWITSSVSGGASFTRRLGAAIDGADCNLSSAGLLTFYPTSVPAASEIVTVTYRTEGEAVARLANEVSVSALNTAVVPGVSRWIGSVKVPAARSSFDCENAALALLSIATAAGGGIEGEYQATSLQLAGDVWPGDQLSIQRLGADTNVFARSVTIINQPCVPEVLDYSIRLANDWGLDLSIHTSSTVPKTVWLPQSASIVPSSLPSLSALTVSIATGRLAVSAGATAPAGGGFEVRRVDWQFGPGSDGTLVLRSPVPNFSILREAAIEQYFVRMYDAATPPNYSRFSSVICVSVPL